MNGTKKILIFLSIATVLVLGMLALNLDREMSTSARDSFWTDKTFNEGKYQLVICGDSRVYRGVSAEIVQESSGLSTYNFGYSSGSFSQQMLDHSYARLDKEGRAVMLLGITPHSLTKSAAEDVQFKLESDRSTFEVWKRKNLVKPLSYFDPIKPSEVFGLAGNFDKPDVLGWMPNEGMVVDTAKGLEHYKKVFIDNPIDEKIYNNLLEFIQKVTAEGIEVYAFRPPTMVSMEVLEDEITGFDVIEVQADIEAAGGKWIPMNSALYQTYDGSHLQEASAIQLSELLGKSLAN